VRKRRALTVVIGVLLGLLLTSVGAAPAAYAHAVLIGTAPGNGEHLAVAPAEIRLRFSERVNLVEDGIILLDATGVRRDQGQANIPPDPGTDVVLPVPAGLGDGVFTLSWRVVSTDSHPLRGVVAFSVGTATVAAAADAGGAGGDAALNTAFWLVRWLGYAGLALLAGGVGFLYLCWRPGWSWPLARRLLALAWGVSLACAFGALLLQGPYGAGATLRRVADVDLLHATLGTDYGRYVVARLGLLVIGGGLLLIQARRPDGPRPVAAAGVIVLGVALPVTWSGTGHANAQPGVLPAVADTVHLAAMGAWVGGLAFLAVCVLPRSANHPAAEVATALARFSRIATVAVAALALTGLYQAWRGLGSWSALPGSSYGTLLVFKLALIGLLLWLGALSRSAVRSRYLVLVAPSFAEGSTRNRRRAARADQVHDQLVRGRLRRSVGAEAALTTVVLAVTSLLVATPPGARSDAAPVRLSSAYTADLPLDGGGRIRAELDPPRVGSSRLTLRVLDALGQPWDVPEVSSAFTLAEPAVGPLPVSLQRQEAGRFTSDALLLPRAGRWRLQVTIRTSEIDAATVTTDVEVT
jgi:copper transport protein